MFQIFQMIYHLLLALLQADDAGAGPTISCSGSADRYNELKMEEPCREIWVGHGKEELVPQTALALNGFVQMGV